MKPAAAGRVGMTSPQSSGEHDSTSADWLGGLLLVRVEARRDSLLMLVRPETPVGRSVVVAVGTQFKCMKLVVI